MANEIPYLRGKLSQKEMKERAMKSIRERKKGKYKLTYDKATKTIIAVPTEKGKMANERLTEEGLMCELAQAYNGTPLTDQAYNLLKEVVRESFASSDPDWEEIKAAEYERGLKDAQQKPTVSREEISSAIYEGRNWDDGTFHEGDAQKSTIKLLEERGIKLT